jgi:hypothetical protein
MQYRRGVMFLLFYFVFSLHQAAFDQDYLQCTRCIYCTGGGGGEGGGHLIVETRKESMLNNNARKECLQDLHLGKVEHIFMDYKASKDMMAYSALLIRIYCHLLFPLWRYDDVFCIPYEDMMAYSAPFMKILWCILLPL